jgi:hypothetical protein
MKKKDSPVLHPGKPKFMDPENGGPCVNPAPSTTTLANATPPPRTPDEQTILNVMVRSHAQAYVDKWAESILAQARAIGDL